MVGCGGAIKPGLAVLSRFSEEPYFLLGVFKFPGVRTFPPFVFNGGEDLRTVIWASLKCFPFAVLLAANAD